MSIDAWTAEEISATAGWVSAAASVAGIAGFSATAGVSSEAAATTGVLSLAEATGLETICWATSEIGSVVATGWCTVSASGSDVAETAAEAITGAARLLAKESSAGFGCMAI